MSRRRRPRGIWASDLPRIRDDLIRDLHDNVAELRDAGRNAEARELAESGIAEQLATAELWWVSEPMTRLAYHAHEDLPEWTPHLARPSRSGITIWHRGTGLTTEWIHSPQSGGTSAITGRTLGLQVPVHGVAWHTDPVTGQVCGTPLTHGPHTPPGVLAWPTSASRDDMAPDGRDHRIWDMLGATWLLADQPTIGVRRPPRDDEAQTLGRRGRDPSPITVVALREILTHDQPGDPDPDHETGRREMRRHIVRGHWRQQACGPSRQWRKPTYVAPFARGRGDLIETTVVRVWRR